MVQFHAPVCFAGGRFLLMRRVVGGWIGLDQVIHVSNRETGGGGIIYDQAITRSRDCQRRGPCFLDVLEFGVTGAGIR